jgi:hypothetical protein
MTSYKLFFVTTSYECNFFLLTMSYAYNFFHNK